MKMGPKRTQLNINIDPELLLKLKSEAIKNGQTLTKYVTDQLANHQHKKDSDYLLEQRLLKIEQKLGLVKSSTIKQNEDIGVIFTDEGAKLYGEIAKEIFDSHIQSKGLSLSSALKDLARHLNNYKHSDPELVFQILLGNHVLTGLEMTKAYRKGSCGMRTALCDWTNDNLEPLNEAFLNAVITKNLK
ncbi:hypothetical protein [Prochlorococcus marinus]|uniref:hypothetical protein n=1 Tax=Prochlorococcus marinus TaxID=1219 RepID=UPI0022B5A0B1|nr:hypothetical protein [Prochlorococcus marinus]